MSLDTLNAVVEGYSDRVFDLQILQVHSGYWNAYYANSKHPKSVNTIVKQMARSRTDHGKQREHADTVDVEAFLAREKAFKERLLQSQQIE